MKPLFGPAGNSDSFSKEYKSSKDAPRWIQAMGLSAYEYQCGRGVNIGEVTARAIGEQAKAFGIAMSVHAPYFINISSCEPERMEKNIGYILGAARCADYMGGTRIVVHMGGVSKLSRDTALKNSIANVKSALEALEKNGLGQVTMCIETMGKTGSMGDLNEVLQVCRSDDRLLPCIDFGHLNARTGGGLKSYEGFANIFDQMESKLGVDRARVFHSHFSRIEYSKGGEVKHLTFEDEKYGPFFDNVARLTHERGYSPTFICESAGTQAQDALKMKEMYDRLRGGQ